MSPFSPQAIDARVEEALARVPEGKQGALLGWVDLEGAHLVVAERLPTPAWLPGEWSLTLQLDKPWDSGFKPHAEIKGVW